MCTKLCAQNGHLQHYLLQQNKPEYLSNGLLNSLNHAIAIQQGTAAPVKTCAATQPYFRCTTNKDLCSMLYGSLGGQSLEENGYMCMYD